MIGVSQLNSLNLIPQKNASRVVKGLLGKEFQFLKVLSELHPKRVDTLTLEQFGLEVLGILPRDPTGNQGFPISKTNENKEFKRISGNAFQSVKFATSLHPKKIEQLNNQLKTPR